MNNIRMINNTNLEGEISLGYLLIERKYVILLQLIVRIEKCESRSLVGNLSEVAYESVCNNRLIICNFAIYIDLLNQFY